MLWWAWPLLLIATVKVDRLPLNAIQVIGSHNSYKHPIDPGLYRLLRQADSNMVKGIDYSHQSLTEQLNLGLCNLELDVYADTLGGKYAAPKGLTWAGDNAAPFDPQGEMKAPGFKVLHVQDIDFRSNCLSLQSCLQELRQWSTAHPNHLPIFITFNAKDDRIPQPGFTVPDPFNTRLFDLLDAALASGLGRDRIITPDQVRGQYPTLEAAVLAGNWPKLKAARGKFVLLLDETGAKRAAYQAGHPSLRNRLMFINTEPGNPEASWLVLNDPVGQQEQIRAAVAKGYLVRTRADSGTTQARNNDYAYFEAACRSNAQIISTDYYRPSTHFASSYAIKFPEGGYFRPNPGWLTGPKKR